MYTRTYFEGKKASSLISVYLASPSPKNEVSRTHISLKNSSYQQILFTFSDRFGHSNRIRLTMNRIDFILRRQNN